MREIEIGSHEYTKVICMDDGASGACHSYLIKEAGSIPTDPALVAVNFQNGFIKENGVNGCHNEDLIAIVIDRLQCFQVGEYACRENAIALTKLQESLMWLRKRTDDRKARGVLGTSMK